MALPGGTCCLTFVGAVPNCELLDWPRAVVSLIVHAKGLHLFSVSTDVEKLTQTALDTSCVAHAQAVDVHMNKQGLPPTIHTTSGLSAAKANNNPTSENK